MVVLDLHLLGWSNEPVRSSLPLPVALSNLLVFLNAHLALSHENTAAILAAGINGASYLFPTTKDVLHNKNNETNDTGNNDISMDEVSGPGYRPFVVLDQQVKDNLKLMLEEQFNENNKEALEKEIHDPSRISAGLALALSHINIVSQKYTAATDLQSRILIISVSEDFSVQYIPFMNCVFAAQKKVFNLSNAKTKSQY